MLCCCCIWYLHLRVCHWSSPIESFAGIMYMLWHSIQVEPTVHYRLEQQPLWYCVPQDCSYLCCFGNSKPLPLKLLPGHLGGTGLERSCQGWEEDNLSFGIVIMGGDSLTKWTRFILWTSRWSREFPTWTAWYPVRTSIVWSNLKVPLQVPYIVWYSTRMHWEWTQVQFPVVLLRLKTS